jgi:hypothetical protein
LPLAPAGKVNSRVNWPPGVILNMVPPWGEFAAKFRRSVEIAVGSLDQHIGPGSGWAIASFCRAGKTEKLDDGSGLCVSD